MFFCVYPLYKKKLKYCLQQHPETTVQEFHGNLPADDHLFEAQLREPKNVSVRFFSLSNLKVLSLTIGQTRLPKEYITLDKGTIVHENVHHHIHHVIQPVIQQKGKFFHFSIHLFLLISMPFFSHRTRNRAVSHSNP
jgi:hypothetical protein